MKSVYLAVIAALFCTVSTRAARAEIATNLFGAAPDVYLLFIDGKDLVRTRCRSGTTIYDRATCDLSRVKASAATVLGGVQKRHQTAVDAAETAAREARIKMDRVETRLQEMYETSPADPEQVATLSAQIAALDKEAKSLLAKALALADQVARLEDQVEASGDADDIAQLSQQRAALAAAVSAQANKQAAIDAVRTRLLAVVASDGAPIFDDLVAQRIALEGRWKVARETYDKELADAAATARVFHMFAEPFVFEFLVDDHAFDGLKPACERLVRELADWLGNPYYFRSGAPVVTNCGGGNSVGQICDVSVKIQVRRGSTLARINCNGLVNGTSCLGFYVTPPSRAFSVEFGNPLDGPILSPASPGNSASDPIFKEKAFGTWEITSTPCVIESGRQPHFACELVTTP